MKRWLPPVLLMLLVAGIFGAWRMTNLGRELCVVRKENVCMYVNTDDRILYTNPEVPMDEATAIESLNCGRTDIRVVKLFGRLPPLTAQTGWTYERNAIICGEQYYIQEFTDYAGPRLFGPFDFFRG